MSRRKDFDIVDTFDAEYITYPRNFVTYKWSKPILVFILFLFFYLIMSVILAGVLYGADETALLALTQSNVYDAMDITTAKGVLVSTGSVALMLPALALSVFITKERPFSSYSSARGGWNWKIFFLSLLVALTIYVISTVIFFIKGDLNPADMRFTVDGFILLTLIGPIQCVAEEYVIRGWLMQTVGSWTRMPVFALIIQGAIFMALHPYNGTGRITVFFSAVILGLCAWLGRGLELSSGLHIVNNMVAFYLTGFGVDRIQSEVTAGNMITSIVQGIIFLAVMSVITRKCSWFHQRRTDDIRPFEEKMAKRADARRVKKKGKPGRAM